MASFHVETMFAQVICISEMREFGNGEGAF
jgi:hypothetical protein